MASSNRFDFRLFAENKFISFNIDFSIVFTKLLYSDVYCYDSDNVLCTNPDLLSTILYFACRDVF